MRWVSGGLCFLFLFFCFCGCDLRVDSAASGCRLVFMGCDGQMLVGGGSSGLILVVVVFFFFFNILL